MADLLTGQLAILAAVCIAAALCAWLALTPRPIHATPTRAAEPQGPALLFDSDDLIDASPDLHGQLDVPPDELSWWSLRNALIDIYPDLPVALDTLPDRCPTLVSAREGIDAGSVLLERLDRKCRVRLPADALTASRRQPAIGDDLDTVRAAVDAAPYPAWRTDADGAVIWYNAAYAGLAGKLLGEGADLSRPLFDTQAAAAHPGQRTRAAVTSVGGARNRKLWFDVTVVRQDMGDLHFANDINAVVDAEIAQRNFVQTLAKTFAQLSTGLAIFDRNRQLALFNPALIDLTSLPVDFLSSRPTLFTFLDRLRDQRMLPEPRDYQSWRQQMAELDAAASDGSYQETWSLPSGSVYAVSGRPHPDGAVALLFEDITAEVTLTRRFRAELGLSQAVLDRMQDAVAVFSSDGVLAFSNVAFNTLWGIDPDKSFAQVTILDAARTWQDQSAPTPVWGDVRDFVAQRETRAEWEADIRLRDGTSLSCTVYPIPNGATMVRFAHSAGTSRAPVSRATPQCAEPADA